MYNKLFMAIVIGQVLPPVRVKWLGVLLKARSSTFKQTLEDANEQGSTEVRGGEQLSGFQYFANNEGH